MADNLTMKIAIGATLAGTFSTAFLSAKQQVKSLAGNMKQLNSRQARLQATANRVSKAYSSGIVSLQSYQNAVRQLGIEIIKLHKADHKRKMNFYGERASAALGTAVKAGAAAFTLAAPIRDAVRFESTMADVRKVVVFDTPQQFKEMSNDILNLSNNLPMSAEGIAQIVAAGGQAGIAKSELLGFAEAASKMGIAFDITAEEAGDMMAKWRTAFKMGQGDVVELADKINLLGNTTAASAPLISDVVTRIGPLGEVGGVASGEIAALGATMIGSGVQSEVAATGIKNLILGLTSGSSATSAQAEAFTKLGLNAQSMADMMQTDAKGAIMKVMHALKGLNKEAQVAALKDLFGKESIGAIAPLLSNLEGLQNNFAKVGDKTAYAGSMQAEYEERSKTTANNMQLLKNRANAIAITVGSALLPSFNSFLEVVGNVAEWLAKWAQANPNLIASLLGVGIVLSGAAAATALLTSGILRIMQVCQGAIYIFNILQLKLIAIGPYIKTAGSFFARFIAMLSGSVGKAAQVFITSFKAIATSVRMLGIAMMSNPILLAIMAIALGALLVYEYWEPIKAFFLSLWPIIQQAWNSFIMWCSNSWDVAITAVRSFGEGLQAVIGAAVQWCIDKWNQLREFLAHPIDTIVNFAQGITGGSANVIANAAGGIYRQGTFLTTFAEKSGEAAIPLDGSKRATGLWMKTGQLMGLLPHTAGSHKSEPVFSSRRLAASDALIGSTGGGIVVDYRPNITIQGNADRDVIIGALSDARIKLEEQLEKIHNQQRRLEYA